MKVAILQANLGNFDKPIDPVTQDGIEGVEITFHRWTDDNFPPVTGLTPRLQYRIPKTHGWEMFPGYDYYIWLDGSVSLQRRDCVKYYLDQIGKGDICLFPHPNRSSVKEEVEHIEDHLKRNKPYITERYAGGRHREWLDRQQATKYKDEVLYASTAFIYRNVPWVQDALRDWWYTGSLYFTCDQVQLPYILWDRKLDVRTFDEPIFKSGYISLVSHHNKKEKK